MLTPLVLLTAVAFLPAAGALFVLLFSPAVLRGNAAVRWFTLGVTVATFAASIVLLLPKPDGATDARFAIGEGGMQNAFFHDWIASFNISYAMGVDGISLPLVVLTTLIGVLAMAASWGIDKYVKAYCVLFLLLLTGILGVFLSLDLFLFYIFWEVMLLPMYFLIGVWGGPRRLYAAVKFFLFTLFGGVLMLIGILLLYFASDLTALNPGQLQTARLIDGALSGEALAAAAGTLHQQIAAGEMSRHTFNILALQQMGQHTALFSGGDFLFGQTLGWWAFVLLFIGFLIKVPAVPMHTWLPDAHVEAPTPISMILAGILLKLGGYGILRLCYPIYPQAGLELRDLVCGIGIVSMIYGALAAMAATDFKRLVAYSSVSHMGYVLLGIGAWHSGAWHWGLNGAMFQMIAHGISSAGMFFMVGVIYDRVHHRNLNEFGGIFNKMPLYGGLSFGIFFAGLGLPGLCGFIGEVLVVFAAWQYHQVLAVIAAAVVMLTAGYILWTLQRVYLGSEYKGPHGDRITPITFRETAIAAPILAFAILFGVYPQPIFQYVSPSIEQTAGELDQWRTRMEAEVAHWPNDGKLVQAE